MQVLLKKILYQLFSMSRRCKITAEKNYIYGKLLSDACFYSLVNLLYLVIAMFMRNNSLKLNQSK